MIYVASLYKKNSARLEKMNNLSISERMKILDDFYTDLYLNNHETMSLIVLAKEGFDQNRNHTTTLELMNKKT